MSAGDKKRRMRLSAAFCSMRKRPSRTLPSVPIDRMRQIHTRLAAPATARSTRSRSASATGSACAAPAPTTSASAAATAALLLGIPRLAPLHLGVDLFLPLARGQDLFPRPPPQALE